MPGKHKLRFRLAATLNIDVGLHTLPRFRPHDASRIYLICAGGAGYPVVENLPGQRNLIRSLHSEKITKFQHMYSNVVD